MTAARSLRLGLTLPMSVLAWTALQAAEGAPGSGAATAPKAPSAVAATPPVAPADAKAATEAALAYLNALKDAGFAAAPAHLHPQALERFKTLVMPRLEQEQARGSRRLLNATFGREASVATARAADPADFMSRFVRVVVARDPETAPRFTSLTPLGAVAEGERIHVLVRLGEGESGRLEVVSVLPEGKTWKVQLDNRLESIARSLGGPTRADRPRMEPMPEGTTSQPQGPQGPAGLPGLPPPR